MEAVKKASSLQSQYTMLGNGVVIAFALFPGVLQLLSTPMVLNSKLPLVFYYPGMTIFPAIFITIAGSWRTYMDVIKVEASRGFLKTIAAFVLCTLGGLCFELVITYLTWLPKNPAAVQPEPSFFQLLTDMALWKNAIMGPGNPNFLIVNPLCECFFFRLFLHREFAARFFPSTDAPEEQLVTLTTGKPLMPKVSEMGAWALASCWSVYHYVPLVIIDLPIFATAGYTYWIQVSIVAWLCILGRFFIWIRENQPGWIGCWAWHIGLDIDDTFFWSFVLMRLGGGAH